MRTLDDVMAGTPVVRPEHLPADLEVPILVGLQCQGDIAVVPAATVPMLKHGVMAPLPVEGWEVVRGTADRNPHLLVADAGAVTFTADVTDPTGLAAGVIDVATETFLIHPEHGANGIGPGRYVIRRQREMTAAGWRRVAD